MYNYTNFHCHTDHSNYRLIDCINKVGDLIKYAKELGHNGVAITDHETLGASVIALHTMKDLKSSDPEYWKDFKLVLGNEIYLCDRRSIQEDKIYEFPHFILIAKNKRGHEGLTKLSTKSWTENSFVYVNMRVPTFYDNLVEIMKDYKGDIVASTACLGGTLPKMILNEYTINPKYPNYATCLRWIGDMQTVFGEDNFFLELQPSEQEEQIIVNKEMLKLAKTSGANYIITTDAHYLKKEDRKIHEAFLKSKEEDREVDDFYNTTYMMSVDEIHEYMDKYLGKDNVDRGIANTKLIYDMVEEYSLDKPMTIPYIPADKTEPSEELYNKYVEYVPTMKWFMESDYAGDRHLLREILNKMNADPDMYEREVAYKEIETCFNSIKISSEKQKCHWSAYLLMTKEIVNTCWESGSLVGASRGSGGGFLFLYMLDICQINPLREEAKLYHWRFLNPERVSPLDIDIDVIGELRDAIIENLQNKYGGYYRVAKVQTLSTSAPRKSIQIACRGLGYTPEEGVYLGGFIQSDRGLMRSLSQTFNGDPDNDMLPDMEFRNLMSGKYKDVWEVAQRLEGLIVGTGQHAGGVVVVDHDITDSAPLMKTKSGAITTQYDLHNLESCSLIKWDVLAIDALTKIKACLDLLLKDGQITWQGSLKDTYEKYLGVYNIDRLNPEIWDLIDNHKILSLFQFEKASGYKAIELGKPRNLESMAALNSVMRLMAQEPGGEAPLDRYARMREHIDQWYDEMDQWGLTKEEQKWLEKYALSNYGLLPNQENFQLIVQDPMVGGYSLLWADQLRKSIAKKNPKAFLELQKEFYENITQKGLSYKLCDYVWRVLISMSKGYGFNLAHTLGYSIVALQEANLAYKYPAVYWNCANLISDSGGLDSTVNYGKIATAVSRLRREGINVVPPDINLAEFDFKPVVEKNEIVFGLKPIKGVGASEAQTIEANRPYKSLDDFCEKIEAYKIDCKAKGEDCKFGDSTIIQLIKAGSFDEIEGIPREEIMEKFIRKICKPLKSLSFSNIEDLAKLKLLTDDQKKKELRYYRYKNYVYSKCPIAFNNGKSAGTAFYLLDSRALPFFEEHFMSDLTLDKDYMDTDNGIVVKRSALDKIIDKKCADFKKDVLQSENMLNKVNDNRFKLLWDEKIEGNISHWEMDSMCYYYHEHELAKADKVKNNLSNFFDLPTEPEIVDNYYFNGQQKFRYNLTKICGVVVDKDQGHHTVSILTTDGVVVVKLYKGQYTFYAKDIVTKDITGKKVTLEESWFKKGTKLLVAGFRSDENFIAKKYADSLYSHTIQQIKDIDSEGVFVVQSERYDPDADEDYGV